MNEKLKIIVSNLRSGKVIFIIGIIGILFIFISSVIPEKTKDTALSVSEFNIGEYKAQLEKDVKEIVADITGSKDVTVFITLESGMRYNYADETKISSSDKASGDAHDTTEGSENKYIIITDSNGNEKALTLYEQLPEVRGVAVIYSGTASEKVQENIKNAVISALGITSKRIFITNKGGN